MSPAVYNAGRPAHWTDHIQQRAGKGGKKISSKIFEGTFNYVPSFILWALHPSNAHT